MKPEDLEFLRKIRGCFGSRRIWCIEYEFTGEEVIERRGGRVKNQIRISDIIETKVKISPHQLILKTSNSKMTVQILPSLNEVIKKKGAEEMASKSDAERQHFEKVKQEMESRIKRTNIIVGIILLWLGIIFAVLIGWLFRKH
jgi:hypothetical protein